MWIESAFQGTVRSGINRAEHPPEAVHLDQEYSVWNPSWMAPGTRPRRAAPGRVHPQVWEGIWDLGKNLQGELAIDRGSRLSQNGNEFELIEQNWKRPENILNVKNTT